MQVTGTQRSLAARQHFTRSTQRGTTVLHDFLSDGQILTVIRWWLTGTVILLNLANYAHWIAFPAVAKKAAAYYDVTGDKLDVIPTISYAAGVPTCLVATYIVEQKGLKLGLRIGAYLTGGE